ncbi:MAG: hypothetical protein M3Q79_00780 [bacterium]|nr:hypothetical protein [bacterium]
MPTIDAFEVFEDFHDDQYSTLYSRAKRLKPGMWLLRRVNAFNLDMTGKTDLPEVLSEVDRCIDFMSSAIGGLAVAHRWVLLRPHYYNYSLESFGLPADYDLGALVEIVDGPKLSQSYRGHRNIHANDQLTSATRNFFLTNGWHIPDLSVTSQFLKASTGPVLVDIEPRISTRI